MRVDVALTPCEVDLYDLTGKTVVVIDVFRFTTALLAALEAGAAAFAAVAEPAEAEALRAADPALLLAGERQALKIPGFDFGNSPLEHLGRAHNGRKIVFCTTNGTKAVQLAAGAKSVLLASLRTAKATARFLQKRREDVLFIPAGIAGKFSLEDTWCAGLIISYLATIELGDGALTAKLLAEKIPVGELAESEHGQNLQRLGFYGDLEFCLQRNASSRLIAWDAESGWGGFVERTEVNGS